MRQPPGYEIVHGPKGAEAVALAKATPWVRSAFEEHGTLHAAAIASAGKDSDAPTLRGRGPVPVVDPAGERWVVRHYFRGGAMAHLLHDRYLRFGTTRPVSEARWAREADRRGVPTPDVVAGAVYPAGLFYRADIVTEFVPDSRELASVLFGTEAEGDGPEPLYARDALTQAGRLIVHAAEAGLFHPDMNARNVLLAGSGDALEPWLIDLDRCRFDVAGPDLVTGAMTRRLERSLHKIAAASGRPVEAEWIEVLRWAVRDGGPLGGRKGGVPGRPIPGDELTEDEPPPRADPDGEAPQEEEGA